jgi:hypothetical protein
MSNFGIPSHICTDNATQFKGIFEDMLNLARINHYKIQPYSHQENSIVEVSHCPQQTLRPHIHDGWNLLPRWPASSNPTELIYFMIAARSQNLMVNHFHLDLLDIPQVGSLILTDTDSRLRASIPPKTFLNRLITALRNPPITMATMTAEEREYVLDDALDDDMGLGVGQQGPAAAQ